MNIPIQNIYYLLCYAWNKLEEEKVVKVQDEDTTELMDLFAKVLINGTTYLFKKGLDRGYISIAEDTRRIKGKIIFGPSLKRTLFRKAMAHCEYDELNYNILHNQILKSTIKNLMKVQGLDKDLKNELHLIYGRFPFLDEIKIKNRHFSQIKLHRNNYFYDFLIKVCEIVHHCILIDEQTGKYKFMDFIRDKDRMNRLFEEFVRNFYKKEQKVYRVYREKISWTLEKEGEYDAYLPGMETDISLEDKDNQRKIVIDTKFYETTFQVQSRFESHKKVFSSDLYQLFAYLKNLEKKGGMNKRCQGILLYPVVDEEVDIFFNLPNHLVRVKTLKLGQNWRGIRNDLKALIA